MAEHLDVAPSPDMSVLDRVPMRGAEGEIRPEFVEEIARAIKTKDAPFLRGWSPSFTKPTSAISSPRSKRRIVSAWWS
jgi:hypothetical protein